MSCVVRNTTKTAIRYDLWQILELYTEVQVFVPDDVILVHGFAGGLSSGGEDAEAVIEGQLHVICASLQEGQIFCSNHLHTINNEHIDHT